MSPSDISKLCESLSLEKTFCSVDPSYGLTNHDSVNSLLLLEQPALINGIFSEPAFTNRIHIDLPSGGGCNKSMVSISNLFKVDEELANEGQLLTESVEL